MKMVAVIILPNDKHWFCNQFFAQTKPFGRCLRYVFDSVYLGLEDISKLLGTYEISEEYLLILNLQKDYTREVVDHIFFF
jgi:hypothetical protein